MLAEVNMVSAGEVAKSRGLTVTESRQEQSPVYDSLIRITVTSKSGARAFAGSVVAGAPRITEVKGMDLEAPLAPAMLYVNNLDKPGSSERSAVYFQRQTSTSRHSTSAARLLAATPSASWASTKPFRTICSPRCAPCHT